MVNVVHSYGLKCLHHKWVPILVLAALLTNHFLANILGNQQKMVQALEPQPVLKLNLAKKG